MDTMLFLVDPALIASDQCLLHQARTFPSLGLLASHLFNAFLTGQGKNNNSISPNLYFWLTWSMGILWKHTVLLQNTKEVAWQSVFAWKKIGAEPDIKSVFSVIRIYFYTDIKCYLVRWEGPRGFCIFTLKTLHISGGTSETPTQYILRTIVSIQLKRRWYNHCEMRCAQFPVWFLYIVHVITHDMNKFLCKHGSKGAILLQWLE